MRKLTHIVAAAMAAASLSAFAMPTYAAAAEQSSAQDTQAWCDVVPPFCGCNNNARCRPGPCQGTVTGDRARNDQGICAAKRED